MVLCMVQLLSLVGVILIWSAPFWYVPISLAGGDRGWNNLDNKERLGIESLLGLLLILGFILRCDETNNADLLYSDDSVKLLYRGQLVKCCEHVRLFLGQKVVGSVFQPVDRVRRRLELDECLGLQNHTNRPLTVKKQCWFHNSQTYYWTRMRTVSELEPKTSWFWTFGSCSNNTRWFAKKHQGSESQNQKIVCLKHLKRDRPG